MTNFKIALLPGDGIGPEVCQEAVKILQAIEKISSHDFSIKKGLIGGAAWPVYKNHFPQETKDLCLWSDAVLFGSVGGPVELQSEPQWHNCERDSILAIRKFLQLVINIRPAKIYPELAELSILKSDKIPEKGLEITTFRELSQGLYFGEHKTWEENGDKHAQDICNYSRSTIEIIARFAFAAAQQNGQKIASVDKANVLDTSRLWRETVDKISQEFPGVKYEHWLVDNCAQQLVKNPDWFEYLLTENLFGDILSDLTSTFAGSLGLLPSASFSADGFGLYEPSGGSAPKRAGQNIINPIAQILCVELMLRHSFKLEKEADLLGKAVENTITNGWRTYDIFLGKTGENKISTSEMGDKITEELLFLAK
jgi:3-isopropylmalate dehydrogenase